MCHCRSGALPSRGEQCLKQPKFNNARAIIVLAGQKQLGDLRTAESTILETLDVNFYGKFCCRGEVSGT